MLICTFFVLMGKIARVNILHKNTKKETHNYNNHCKTGEGEGAQKYLSHLKYMANFLSDGIDLPTYLYMQTFFNVQNLYLFKATGNVYTAEA